MQKRKVSIPSVHSPIPVCDLFLGSSAAGILTTLAHPGGWVYYSIPALLSGGASLYNLIRYRSSLPERINFLDVFGVDGTTLEEMPRDERRKEARVLQEMVNDEYVPQKYAKNELTPFVNQELSVFLAKYTGEFVEIPSQIKSWNFSRLLFPFDSGACTPWDGEVYLYKDRGVFQPSITAHELAHRYGYMKELEAEALSYLSLVHSEEPSFRLSSHCQRLLSQLTILSEDSLKETIQNTGLREELKHDFLMITQKEGRVARFVDGITSKIYDSWLQLNGQNGTSDYHQGFTNFLYSIEEMARKERFK